MKWLCSTTQSKSLTQLYEVKQLPNIIQQNEEKPIILVESIFIIYEKLSLLLEEPKLTTIDGHDSGW